jgi:hypothetical protein
MCMESERQEDGVERQHACEAEKCKQNFATITGKEEILNEQPERALGMKCRVYGWLQNLIRTIAGSPRSRALP